MCRLACLVAFSLLLLACSEAGTPLPAAGDVLLQGTVRRVDLEPMVRDGDGRVWIEDVRHGSVQLLLPARAAQLCRADYRVDVGTLAAGMRLRARGRVSGPGQVRICAGASHFLASGQASPH